MKDQENQSGKAEAFPGGARLLRQLRRITEPIGVIDVRHAAVLHARSNLRPAQRLELLNNLKQRYGLGRDGVETADAARAVAMPLPFQSSSEGRFDSPSTHPSGNRTEPRENTTGTATDTLPEPAAQHYRVKRTDNGLELSLPRPLPAQTVTPRSFVARTFDVGGVSAPVMPFQRKSGEAPDRAVFPVVRTAEAVASAQAEDNPGARNVAMHLQRETGETALTGGRAADRAAFRPVAGPGVASAADGLVRFREPARPSTAPPMRAAEAVARVQPEDNPGRPPRCDASSTQDRRNAACRRRRGGSRRFPACGRAWRRFRSGWCCAGPRAATPICCPSDASVPACASHDTGHCSRSRAAHIGRSVF